MRVAVGVRVAVAVRVRVGVLVRVGVGVSIEVAVALSVDVAASVAVAVGCNGTSTATGLGGVEPGRTGEAVSVAASGRLAGGSGAASEGVAVGSRATPILAALRLVVVRACSSAAAAWMILGSRGAIRLPRGSAE